MYDVEIGCSENKDTEKEIKLNLKHSLIGLLVSILFIIAIIVICSYMDYYVMMPDFRNISGILVSLEDGTITKIDNPYIIEATYDIAKKSYGSEASTRDIPSEYDEESLISLDFIDKYNRTTSLYVYSKDSTAYYIEQPNYAVVNITDKQYNFIRNLAK